MNKFDAQRKDTLVKSLLKAKADAERFLLYIVEDDSNTDQVEEVRAAKRNITWALNGLTKGEETG